MKRINVDFRDIVFEHTLAQIHDEVDDGYLFIVIIGDDEMQHEIAMTFGQATDLRDVISLGLMSMVKFEEYENVVRLDE